MWEEFVEFADDSSRLSEVGGGFPGVFGRVFFVSLPADEVVDGPSELLRVENFGYFPFRMTIYFNGGRGGRVGTRKRVLMFQLE